MHPGDDGGKRVELHQLNVKTALLNCDLDEEFYMEQPEDTSIPSIRTR